MATPGPKLGRTFWLLWSGSLLNRLGDFIYPFLALYLTGSRGLSIAFAGSVLALYGIGSTCAGPVGGLLADRIGRRKTILLSTSTGALAMLQLAAARSPLHIAVATLLLGFFNSLYRPAVYAAVADEVAPAERPRAYGLMYWANNLGFGFAALVGGVASGHGFARLFIADASTTLGFGALVYLTVPETRPELPARMERRPSVLADLVRPFRDPLFVVFLGLCFGTTLVFGQVGSMLPLVMRMHGISPRGYGELIAINALLIVLLQLPTVRLARKMPRARAMATASLLIGLGFGANALARAAPAYAAGIVIWTLGEILQMPVGASVVTDLAPVAFRGGYQGAYGLLFASSQALGPLFGGVVLQTFGESWLWYGCLAICIVAAVGHLRLGSALGARLPTALLGTERASPTAQLTLDT